MKYQELANLIRKEISDGEYRDSQKLPTENILMEKYGATRYCVRNAVDILTKLGLVYPVQGSGMFIRESKKADCLSLSNTRGITAEMADREVTTDVLHIELIPADEALASRMKCKAGTPVYYLIRRRKVDGEPLSIEYTYYNQEIIPVIDERIASGSLFGYIKNELGLSIAFADKILYCDKLPKDTADHLGLLEGDPAIVIEDDVYLANGMMFNASKVYYHYKKAKFFDLAEFK